jgi:hypothetical protein
LPAELSPEAADDPLGVEVLPPSAWRGLGKGPFALDELVYEVTTRRCAPERLGKLRVIDKPVRVEGGPVIVGTVSDAVHDVVDLAGLMDQVADPLSTFVHTRNLRGARADRQSRRADHAARQVP